MSIAAAAEPTLHPAASERAVAPEHGAGTSPRVLARIGGALYLVIIAGGLYGEAFLRGRLIVPGDAAATAANLRAMEPLWRLGIASEFFMLICTVCLALVLYLLVRPVSRELALLAVFFNLVSIAVEAVNEQQLIAALLPLGRAESLGAFTPEQLNALASLSLRSYAYGFGVALIFFGCECVVLGSLIFRSGYLPKTIGVLMAAAGACYLVNSFALLAAPAVANRLFPAILLPAFVGELSLCLWLLVKGVDLQRWKARAAASAASAPVYG
jgi:Domain of unknown function (DUF4386)